jgi:hypothetical protein
LKLICTPTNRREARYQVAGTLPGVGPTTVGGVALPAGRRIEDSLWSTDEPPAGALDLWSALAARFAETGLWPIVVFGYAGDWDLEPDEDWQALADQDAETVLRRRWKSDAEFPGLGQGGDASGHEPTSAPESVAALALVPVERGADVPGLIGCEASWRPGSVSAVLRSWEDRYGARLLGMGGATLYLNVQRPPQGDEIPKAAAELRAFCRDLDGDPATMAAHAQWSFWWD